MTENMGMLGCLVANSLLVSALLKLSSEFIERTRVELLGTNSSIDRSLFFVLLQLEISKENTEKYKILSIDGFPLFVLKQR